MCVYISPTVNNQICNISGNSYEMRHKNLGSSRISEIKRNQTIKGIKILQYIYFYIYADFVPDTSRSFFCWPILSEDCVASRSVRVLVILEDYTSLKFCQKVFFLFKLALQISSSLPLASSQILSDSDSCNPFLPLPPWMWKCVAIGDLPSSQELALSKNLGGGLKVAESSQ